MILSLYAYIPLLLGQNLILENSHFHSLNSHPRCFHHAEKVIRDFVYIHLIPPQPMMDSKGGGMTWRSPFLRPFLKMILYQKRQLLFFSYQ